MSKWLELAKELSAISKTGLYYTDDIYDKERYERIGVIANEIMAVLIDSTPSKLAELYQIENGHQTPKIDTRGVVWKDDKLLLVQEKDGYWALPGGWMEVTETISSNVKKEIREEAGCEVEVGKIIAIHDRNIHNPGKNQFTIEKIFVECQFISGQFKVNSETIDMNFFDMEDLPPLMEKKTSYEQIKLAFKAKKAGETWKVIFD